MKYVKTLEEFVNESGRNRYHSALAAYIKRLHNLLTSNKKTEKKWEEWLNKHYTISDTSIKWNEFIYDDLVDISKKAEEFIKDISMIISESNNTMKTFEKSQLSIPVIYKSRTYYVNNKNYNELSLGKIFKDAKLFVYTDSELDHLAKINGKTLMFKIKDLEDNLKKYKVT